MAIVSGSPVLGLVALFVASGLAAQDPEALFQEGVKNLRLGKKAEALAKFEEVLRADPSHEQAFAIWRQTDQDMWRWLMLEEGEISKIAQQLATLAQLRRKEMSRDESAIQALVEKATTAADYGERREAIVALMADHGEFAVPALVEKLADADDTKAQDYAILALYNLGGAATLPLIEALGSESALVRRNVAAALAHLKDPRARGPLMAVANNDASEEVRYVAGKAVAGAEGSAVDVLLRQAQAFLAGRDGADPSGVVWSLRDGKLVATDIPHAIEDLRSAQKFSYMAWRLDPVSDAAKSLWARSLLAEASVVRQALAAGDEAYAELAGRPDEARALALAAGPGAIRSALADARAEGMIQVSVEAIECLGDLEGRASLASSPLVAALDDADKRVRYAAALALVKASGGGTVPAAGKVVAALGSAVAEESLRTILVIDGSETARRAAAEAAAETRGQVVEASASGKAAVGSLTVYPSVDVVVINEILPDVRPEHVIGLIRKDPRMEGTKILVVANDPDASAERFGDHVDGAIQGPLTREALQAKVDEVLEGVDLGPRRKWADRIASSASSALAGLAGGDVDVSAAAASLAAQLDRADDVAVPAARTLASGGSLAQLDALVAAATGDGSAALKAASAEAIGAILQRSDSVPEGTVDALAKALEGADAKLRLSIVAALGRAKLAPGDQLKLVDMVKGLGAADSGDGQ